MSAAGSCSVMMCRIAVLGFWIHACVFRDTFFYCVRDDTFMKVM